MKPLLPNLLLISLGFQAAVGIASARSPDMRSQAPQWAYDRYSASAAVSANLADLSSEPSYPPGSPGLGRQILGGTAFGLGGMFLGGAVGAGLFSFACWQWGEDCGFAGLYGASIGGAVGFGGGFPLGVYSFGTDENVSGSLQWTIASALLGAAVGFGGWAWVSGLDDEDAVFQSSVIGTLGAPIGALIGFNATRGPRKGVPNVSFSPRRGGGWAGQLTWNLGMNR